MEAIELARRLAELGQTQEAQNAYALVLGNSAEPTEKMEAAVYIFQSGGDYRISYTCFRDLYNQKAFREEAFDIMTQAFYEPNINAQKKRYEKNCKLLGKYPYLFRKDFLPFLSLPIRFYPYDDNGYVPFYVEEEWFGEYLNLKAPIISRNFFKNLDNPILADDVYSQYELEYLNDNVRNSERVGRENHVYLHYRDWGIFCAYLQCINLRPLLEKKKVVFLIEDEIRLYPIDFKERFGIDYSQCVPQPIAIREVNRLIWHTQLSAHNGGDFFNEIFDNHPNLVALPSVLFTKIKEEVSSMRQCFNASKNEDEFVRNWGKGDISRLLELYHLKNLSDKDILVGIYLMNRIVKSGMDQNSRIAPALFFQPHFENMSYYLEEGTEGQTFAVSETTRELRHCRFLQEFRYIKTFTPMRRITSSYAATIKYMYTMSKRMEKAEAENPKQKKTVVTDEISDRILNRSFMADPEDRLFKDSVLVRFEDGKLNPKATFIALAAFLDLPYTQNMKTCTQGGKLLNYGIYLSDGFDVAPVYKTYEDYANDAERYYIEYFMRDAYEQYGYDFHYYDHTPINEDQIKELIEGFTTLDSYIRETWKKVDWTVIIKEKHKNESDAAQKTDQFLLDPLEGYIGGLKKKRLKIARVLLSNPQFVNQNGQLLRMMPLLKLDPALLEQPLYH